MKILHINTSDTAGGAAIAAMRLHNAMLSRGIDSYFFCLNRFITDDNRIISVDNKTKFISRSFDVLRRLLFNKIFLSSKKGLFSNMQLGYKIGKFINLNEYDVIYIHWVNNIFLSLKGLEEICKTGKKVYWFMHDMFPITGGCHHSFDCTMYKQSCKTGCPYLKQNNCKHNLSYKQMKLKHKILDKYMNLSFIAPSKWLYECTKSSSLAAGHKVYNIQNLLDTCIFRPLNKVFCREILNLSKDKKIILFGADSALSNPYKGFDFLVEAINLLYNNKTFNYDDIELVIFGSSYNEIISKKLKYKTTFMGYLHDEYTISLLYNAADVFCISSIAENYPNTVLEALHCNTPVVGFNVGGIPDLVCEKTGYLAKYKDYKDFSNGIMTVLQNNNYDTTLTVKQENIIDRHIDLWKEKD